MARELSDETLRRIHGARLIKRQVDELIGLANGVLLDGKVEQHEAEGILAWLGRNRDCLETWPAGVLYDRLREMLADGVLDAEERDDLLGLLMQIASPEGNPGTMTPASLPLTAPAPEILHAGRSFCFTGVFEFGSRAQCHQAVLARGGEPAKGVTKKLDYLVIGAVASDFWKHSSFGTKIITAAEYRAGGAPIAIVSEGAWVSRL
jgi:NAD-dependent DNA ligase